MLHLTPGLRLNEKGWLEESTMAELICGEEVSCDAYVSCNDGMVWLRDDGGNHLVE